MGSLRSFLFGFGSAVFLVACVGAQFPYRYYPYDIDHHRLVGPTPEEDLDDVVCHETVTSKQPCTVVMTPEFSRIKADDLKCHNDLAACQNPPPKP